ncbi:hypothetical protein JCM3775_005812 [Rhodotorula graminis]
MPKGALDPPIAALGSPESERQWLKDLGSLLVDAQERFGDVAWRDDASGKTVYAHKCIVYARATGSFQQRYLGVPHGLSESDLSIYGTSTTSFRTFSPSTIARHDSLVPSAQRHDHHSLRPSSTSSYPSDSGSAVGHGRDTRPLSLGHTDINVFEAALEYFYTASSAAEAFVVALDGFQDGASEEEQGLKGVPRLRQDLLYCWRSKLYSDVSVVLEGVPGEPFAAHRAILASRSPYFHALLLGDYADSNADTFTLPSPPFTPASTTFVLGYIYTGTLDFSPRKFDLATSFEIWRCAAFLSLSTLQSAIEHKVLGQLNPGRAPRVLAFAHAPDVNCARLANAARPLVVEHFDSAWTTTPHVGHLEYDVQKALVRGVCDRIKPLTVADTASRVARARRQLEAESASWADHVCGMLDGVEEALVAVLAQSLPEVVASSGFVDLTEGVGFSTDVLEWLLTLVVKGLRENKAPKAYQALVGSVLLREQGIMADARVLVEDTRSGILGYIKRKWAMIRDAGGFDDLEPWCAKELADELDLKPTELYRDGLQPRTGPAKVRRPPQHLVDGIPSAVERPLRSIAAPRPAGAASSTTARSSFCTSHAVHLVRHVRRPVSPSRVDDGCSSTSACGADTRRHRRDAAPGQLRQARTATSRWVGGDGAGQRRSAAHERSTRIHSLGRVHRVEGKSLVYVRRSCATPPSVADAVDDKPPVGREHGDYAHHYEYDRRLASASSTAHGRVELGGARRSSPHDDLDDLAGARRQRHPASAPAVDDVAPLERVDEDDGSSTSSAQACVVELARVPSVGLDLDARTVNAPPVHLGGHERICWGIHSSRRTPSAAAVAARAAAATPTPGLPGTSLLAGIPCIVTVRTAGDGGQGGKALRVKAQVRYIGGLVDEEGQWVGVEALESAIPPEAANLSWCDGRRGDISYFCLTSASTSLPSEPPTQPTSPALRPPSRRAPRRSASPTGQRESGPRKGLFVRPDQIVYVL